MRTMTVGRQVTSRMRTKFWKFCPSRSQCVRISAKTLRTKIAKIIILGSDLWANRRGSFLNYHERMTKLSAVDYKPFIKEDVLDEWSLTIVQRTRLSGMNKVGGKKHMGDIIMVVVPV